MPQKRNSPSEETNCSNSLPIPVSILVEGTERTTETKRVMLGDTFLIM